MAFGQMFVRVVIWFPEVAITVFKSLKDISFRCDHEFYNFHINNVLKINNFLLLTKHDSIIVHGIS